MGVDTINLQTHTQATKYALNIIDYHTHFQLVIPLDDHTARSTKRAYRQWLRFFGPPRVVLRDLGKEFQADFVRCAEADGSEVDPASLEMPQQRGLTERAGGIFKTMLYKAMDYCRSHRGSPCVAIQLPLASDVLVERQFGAGRTVHRRRD